MICSFLSGESKSYPRAVYSKCSCIALKYSEKFALTDRPFVLLYPDAMHRRKANREAEKKCGLVHNDTPGSHPWQQRSFSQTRERATESENVTFMHIFVAMQ